MVVNEKKGLQESPEGLEPRVYEIGYILIPSIREEDLDKEREALLAHITKLKGEIVSEGKPELIKLGYEMAKVTENKKQMYSEGYFGWAKLSIEPEVLDQLEEVLKKDANVLRYLLIKSGADEMPNSDNPLASILVKKNTEGDEQLKDGELDFGDEEKDAKEEVEKEAEEESKEEVEKESETAEKDEE